MKARPFGRAFVRPPLTSNAVRFRCTFPLVNCSSFSNPSLGSARVSSLSCRRHALWRRALVRRLGTAR